MLDNVIVVIHQCIVHFSVQTLDLIFQTEFAYSYIFTQLILDPEKFI